MTDLHGDAARVTEELERLGRPVVLVGHSYGGAVVTEAGDHPLVRHVVLLAALAIDAHETCMSAAVEESAEVGISWEGRANLGEGFIVADDGTVTLDPEIAAVCLYNDCDPDTVAWALARLGPHPLGNLQQSPTSVAWRVKPSTYVVCADDFGVHPELQRLLAKRCSASIEWGTGHSPFFSRPDLVVGLLAGLAASGKSPSHRGQRFGG
jgi:pimeloyl-ACP methyl ester carboxylesterase